MTKYKLKTMFFQNSGGYSSKRVLSCIGMLSCVIVFILAFIFDKQVPDFGDMLLICCVSLYGVEKIPTFNKKISNES